EGAGRRGAGSARRGGRGAGRGAVTVTCGSVSDTWPQASEAHTPGSGKAPQATAVKSRRFQIGSRDELRRITPHTPNIKPPNFPEGHPELFFRLTSGDVLAKRMGTFGNVSAGPQAASHHRDARIRAGTASAHATFVESIM